MDACQAVHGAREMGLAGTLMNTLALTSLTHAFCGDYVTATAQLEELTGLAEKKGSLYWKAFAMWLQGCLLALFGNAPEAVGILTSGIAAWRSTGATLFAPMQLSYLAAAYAKLGQFDDAWRLIGEAMTAIETTKERSCEAEVNRTAGEIALVSPKPNVAQAEAYFDRGLTVARQQHAKSWELRAAMSLARLWRDQGKPQQARELLAPIYGWFTEGFDTLDLKEAKALLDECRHDNEFRNGLLGKPIATPKLSRPKASADAAIAPATAGPHVKPKPSVTTLSDASEIGITLLALSAIREMTELP